MVMVSTIVEIASMNPIKAFDNIDTYDVNVVRQAMGTQFRA
jgi:hypothetical protein